MTIERLGMLPERERMIQLAMQIAEEQREEQEEKRKAEARKNQPETKEEQRETTIINPNINTPKLDGFVYVPSTGICTAKTRSCSGLDWYQTHEDLAKQNYFMPTINQFREFIKYLKTNPAEVPESEQIIDDILTVREPWRAEWLDADFKVINGELYINSEHRIVNGKLQYQKQEKLEACLMQDKTPGINLDAWINGNNITSQGLPKLDMEVGDLWFWYPRSDNKSVARFVAGSDRASLDCYWDPFDSLASFGVFASYRR